MALWIADEGAGLIRSGADGERRLCAQPLSLCACGNTLVCAQAQQAAVYAADTGAGAGAVSAAAGGAAHVRAAGRAVLPEQRCGQHQPAMPAHGTAAAVRPGGMLPARSGAKPLPAYAGCGGRRGGRGAGISRAGS